MSADQPREGVFLNSPRVSDSCIHRIRVLPVNAHDLPILRSHTTQTWLAANNISTNQFLPKPSRCLRGTEGSELGPSSKARAGVPVSGMEAVGWHLQGHQKDVPLVGGDV